MVNGAILAMAWTTGFLVSEFVSQIRPSFETPGTTTVCEKRTYTSFILSETETFFGVSFHVSLQHVSTCT